MKLMVGRPFDQWRDASPKVIEMYGSAGDSGNGCFWVPVLATGERLFVIATIGAGWDHVSVSHQKRCPTWDEMQYVKRAFFKRDEWAIEYHPPEAKNISLHAFCLHLWRPNDGVTTMPIPPEWTIA